MCTVPLDFTKPIFAMVTGSGRGIGKILIQYLAKTVSPGSKLFGISNLPDKAKQVKELCAHGRQDVDIEVQIMDLTRIDVGDYYAALDSVSTTPNLKEKSYEFALIVHNAGNLGEVGLTENLNDLTAWHEYYDLNLFSCILLNNTFIKYCKPYVRHLFVVNVSSVYTVFGIPKLSMFCSAKAARNAYFSILSKEDNDITVLNYSPGLAKTVFFEELRSHIPQWAELNKTIEIEETVTKLVDTLAKGNYASGSVVDVFGRSLA
ncbi:short chain dehydrogenase [Popillia japonica]|uniref:Short chain dehydrogenase n=1 Tax=Popillia japonica TaxID=7064 RepID=A0AAW1K342_POPJA